MADWNLGRRKHERAVADEIAQEIHRVLGPVQPEMLADRNELICQIFGSALDRHKIVDEPSAARVLAFVPQFLAENHRQFAELQRRVDAAVRSSVPPRPFFKNTYLSPSKGNN